jgi:hypothetical protein
MPASARSEARLGRGSLGSGGRRPGLEATADRSRALAHADEAVPLRHGRCTVRATATVVVHPHHDGIWLVADRNRRATRPRMTDDVRERLLDDSIRRQFDDRWQ